MTPALGLLLTTCALMAVPAKEDDAAARAEATLQKVAKLPPDHQRVWLALVEQRYGWSVLLTMKDEDAKAEQARVAKVIRQKTVGWNDLVVLLGQLDRREKAAISRLVRQYRTQVFDTFDKRPQDMMQRQDAWFRIWSLWEKAGSPAEQQDRLMDWLAAAIKASNKDSIGPLPPDPKFGEGVELVPEELVKQLMQPPKEPQGPPQVAGQPAEEHVPVPELVAREPMELRVPDSRQSLEPMKRPAEDINVRCAESEPPMLIAEAPWAIMPQQRTFVSNVIDGLADFDTSFDRSKLSIAFANPREVLRPSGRFAEATEQSEIRSAAEPQEIAAARLPHDLTAARKMEMPPPDQAGDNVQAAPGLAPVVVPPRVVERAQTAAADVDTRERRKSITTPSPNCRTSNRTSDYQEYRGRSNIARCVPRSSRKPRRSKLRPPLRQRRVSR